MKLVIESRIEDEFNGWDGDNRYTLENGQVWQQVHYEYEYLYAYRPIARILKDGTRFFLQVEGMHNMIEVQLAPSISFLYDSHGNAVGFLKDGFIYLLNGTPIGQLRGTHVHRLAGNYVGELHKDMIVDKHMGNLGNIGHPGNPGNPGSPGNPGNRGAVNYGFQDVFKNLLG